MLPIILNFMVNDFVSQEYNIEEEDYMHYLDEKSSTYIFFSKNVFQYINNIIFPKIKYIIMTHNIIKLYNIKLEAFNDK